MMRDAPKRTAARVVDSTRAAGINSWRPVDPIAMACSPRLRRKAAAPQPIAQTLVRPRQPALDRADRPSQVPGHLLVSPSFEIAEDHRGTIALGKPVDLGVQQLFGLVAGHGLVFQRR